MTSIEAKATALDGLLAKLRERSRLRREVRAWMDAEARQCHLRANREAPAWDAYQQSEIALTDALRALEMAAEQEARDE